MTSLIMPSDYGMEMLVGSPVVGAGFMSSSPYFSDFGARCVSSWSTSSCSLSSSVTTKAQSLACSNYNFTAFSNFQDTPPITTTVPTLFTRTGSFRSSGRDSARRRKQATTIEPIIAQLKPCIIKKEESVNLLDGEDSIGQPSSPTKEKKKVSFADKFGQNLTDVKVIRERPDCPPNWSQEFYEKVTGGASLESPTARWEVTFAQPSANYMTWKNKLDSECVVLESAMVSECENCITGVVKVKNVCYHKEVKIRYTSSDWMYYDEIPALYASPANSSSSSYSIYDTFSFKIPLPLSNSDKIEFCIQYLADGKEMWDNNEGKNYTIVSFRSKQKNQCENNNRNDVFNSNIETWSLFASWEQSMSNERYY